MKVAIEQSQRLLADTKNLFTLSLDKQKKPENFIDLYHAALLLELQNEVAKLLGLFSETTIETIQQGFKTRCLEREKVNTDTAFSFFALPKGYCNQLYQQLACLLFEIKDFQSLCHILLPSIKTCYVFHVFYIKDHHHQRKARLRSEIVEDLSTLKLDYESASLFEELAVHEDCILSLKDIKAFDFHLHLQLFQALQLENPKLHEKLYQHNDAFKQLAFNIALINKSGITPREALTNLHDAFILAGQAYSGNEEVASLSGSIALNSFLTYLEQLPNPFKEAVLNISNHELNIETLILKLTKPTGVSNCVELASTDIDNMLQQPQNQAILDKRPSLNKEDIRKIIKQYHHQAIDIQGLEPARKIPASLAKALLGKLKIKNTEDFIDLLLQIPADEYTTFIHHAKIEFGLATICFEIMDILNHQQKKALENAFFRFPKKAGTYADIRALLFKIQDPLIILKILKIWPFNIQIIFYLLISAIDENRLEFFKVLLNNHRALLAYQDPINGHSLLTYASSTPHINMVRFLVEQGQDLNQVTFNGNTALSIACLTKNLKLIQYLVNNGVDINQANKDGVTIFYSACQKGYTEIIEYLLQDPRTEIEVLVEKQTPLLVACISPDNLNNRKTFELLVPKANIKHKNKYGKTAIDLAFSNKNEDALIVLLQRAQKENYVLNDLMSKETLDKIKSWQVRSHQIIIELRSLKPYLMGVDANRFFSYPSLPLINIKLKFQMTSGHFHTFVLFENGELWARGKNTFGQLGFDIEQTPFISILGKLDCPLDEKITQVYTGFCHSIFVSSSGKIYGCGNNSNYQLGISGRGSSFFTEILIPLLENEQVKHISLSTSHTLILTNKGRLLGSGRNFTGELGFGSKQAFTRIPLLFLEADESIQSITAGNKLSFILTNKGRLFYSGLGVNTPNLIQPIFTEIHLHLNTNEYIKSATYVEYHQIYLLTNEGRFFMSSTTPFTPSFIEITTDCLSENEWIQELYLLRSQSFCLTNKSRLFGLGLNKQRGLEENDLQAFIEINIEGLEPDEKVLSLTTELEHTLLVTDKGRFFKADKTNPQFNFYPLLTAVYSGIREDFFPESPKPSSPF